ncbi:MAG: hypothetical protein KatS3mg121_0758 [Gammaproteobacteria bacterium]|nr:MAG: hypothetical protein KatS3mg121_0758 [Gammaproteobacteria bacterium]
MKKIPVATALLLAAALAWGQEGADDSEAYYEAEQSCAEEAMNQPERDYNEVFSECMARLGFEASGDEAAEEPAE